VKEDATMSERLAAANPVALGSARRFVDDVALKVVLKRVIESQKEGLEPRTESLSKRPLTRRLHLRGLVIAAVALAVGGALAAGPALGWRAFRIVPFFEAQSAPRQTQIDFGSMGTGAPAGMDPGAISEETRKIRQASFSGAVHTLWVAPTKLGGFCYLWSPGTGGCNSRGLERLDAIGELSLPPGVVGPQIPKDATKNEMLSAMRAAHELATVPLWIVGYVKDTDGASKVVIRFRDGTTVEPEVTWVSAPISAGFYAYDVPQDKRTSANHALSVESVSSAGAVIDQQTLAPNR
jgi:hypothetical protein